MIDHRIPKTIISNIGLIPEYGLQYGQLGNLIALFSISRNQNIVPSNVLRKHLIQIISKETMDGSYSIGILGIMIGLLFLKLNKFIKIDFEDIFYKQHLEMTRFSEDLELTSETERFHYLEFLIYSCLLDKCNSELPLTIKDFDERKIAEFYTFNDINDVDKLYSYTQLARRLILLHKLDASLITKTKVNKWLNFIFESSKQNAILSYDSDFLVEVFQYSKENEQDEILRFVADSIRDYIKNIKFNTINYKSFISSYNLLNVVDCVEDFEKAIGLRIMHDMEICINNLDGGIYKNTNLSTLMSLKGGFPRHIIYSNDKLVYKEAILL